MSIPLPRAMLALLALVGALVLSGAPAAMAAPEPTFRTVSRDGAFEVRDYPALVVAEVTVRGGRGEAANAAFRPLADYIFGVNVTRDRIGMTAPVIQQRSGERIGMTSPVTQTAGAGESWIVRFIMPEGRTLASLPEPLDPAVRLAEKPAIRMAVLRFSGLAGGGALQDRTEELRRWIETRGMRSVGPPTYAFYDPPWTLPFLRRNEVMIPVALR
jgi:hypothetical protein